MKKYLKNWWKTVKSVVCIFLLSTVMIIASILAALLNKYEFDSIEVEKINKELIDISKQKFRRKK